MREILVRNITDGPVMIGSKVFHAFEECDMCVPDSTYESLLRRPRAFDVKLLPSFEPVRPLEPRRKA